MLPRDGSIDYKMYIALGNCDAWMFPHLISTSAHQIYYKAQEQTLTYVRVFKQDNGKDL